MNILYIMNIIRIIAIRHNMKISAWMGRLLDNGTGTISNAVDMYSGNLVLATTYTFTGGNYYLKFQRVADYS
jgi:hypothetical protein